MWAAAGGHAGIIRELMGQAADASVRDVRARGALHWAAEKGHVEAVDLLVEKLSELGLDLHSQVRDRSRVLNSCPHELHKSGMNTCLTTGWRAPHWPQTAGIQTLMAKIYWFATSNDPGL